MAIDMFEYGKALADLWALGGRAFLSAQETTAKAFAEGVRTTAGAVPAAPGLPMLPNLETDTAGLVQASQSMLELWTAATQLFATLAQKLPAGDRGIEPTVAATYQKMLDPRAWLAPTSEMDEMVSRLSEGPRLADLWAVERKYARVFQAWVTLRRRSLEHNSVVLQAWLRAGQAFATQLAGGVGGKPAQDPRALLALWTETANGVLLETQRSEPYLRTQAEMVRASTELRMAQRELVEYYGERFGFPTRTELDDVHRSVTELRRELRALRRQMRSSAAPVAPEAQPQTERKPLRKARS